MSAQFDIKRAAEEFAKKHTWAKLLEPIGAEFIDFADSGDLYRHPDAETSVALIADYMGSGLLHVATADLPPLEPGRQYGKFEFHALWNFSGDEDAAAAAMFGKGVGLKRQTPAQPVEPESPVRSNGHVAPGAEAAEIEIRSEAKFEPTDLGNAERFVRAYGENVRHCHKWGQWLIWQGWGFQGEDTGGAVATQLAVDMIRDMAREAFLPENAKDMGAMLAWSGRCHAKARLEATTGLAKQLRGVPVSPSDLDRDPNLLNLRNGTLDLRTLDLREHRRSDLITKVIDIDYDPGASCPFWLAFLARVLDRDEDLIHYVHKAAGYTLTGDTSEKCFFFLHGSGNNGKSIFVETLSRILGPYAKQLHVEALMVQNNAGQGPTNDLAGLKGARMVVSSETEDGRALSESKVKLLTGNDTITCRFMHQEFFSYLPEFKIWIAGNHKPEIRGTDEGIWSRVHLIPFEVCIPKDQRLPATEMHAKLQAEAPGILTWLVEGYRLWKLEGLKPPRAVQAAVEQYRDESDVFGTFLAESTDEDPLAEGIKAADLYNAYVRWAKRQGHKTPKTVQKFGRIMSDRGEPYKKTEEGKLYTGRTLKEAAEQHAMYWNDQD